ncbi:MAG TPA: protein kinase [Pyrinomonadaceae bacterium]|nr:protein kinase [Pyrinomonadaceae bacterium]
MTPERWKQIEVALQDALDRPPDERHHFLEEFCLGDDELKTETVSLIAAHERAGDFIEQPAAATDAHIILDFHAAKNIGREIGAYQIQECLGAGGMGEVYLAEDKRLKRPVALKLLPAYLASDDDRLARFQREALTASALNHPNILTIYEVGEADDIRFIATEFIDGETLQELLGASMTVGQILDVAIQVASALAAAHAAGIVHRDIKPDNIMRRADGLVKLLDFGIAKLLVTSSELPSEWRQTEIGSLIGTVNYMSPEQARGLTVDDRSDIWSFGVVLYQLLAQRLPFAADTRMDTLVNILEREPDPVFPRASQLPSGLQALSNLVMKSLQKDRAKRQRSANELLEELDLIRQQLEPAYLSATAAQLVSPRIRRFENQIEVSRRSVLVRVGLILLMTLMVGLFAYKWYFRHQSVMPIASIAADNITPSYAAMSESQQLAFIQSQEQRISAMMGDRPAQLDDEALRSIKRYVDRYLSRRASVSTDPGREDLQVVFSRAVPYLPTIARAFAARKVPLIIGIYLPMVESEYRPCFDNEIGAKGLFQFMPDTARHYGANDRCDVKQAAPAAAGYIADHMAELGDDAQSMTLVLLSYNTGPAWIRGSLRQLRETQDYKRTFWTLFKNRERLDESFRNEGAGYVPTFFAAAIIGENPRSFGLELEPLSALADVAAVSANKRGAQPHTQN